MIAMQRTPATARSIAGFWGKSLDDKNWYSVKMQADDTAEIRIYDIIGWPFVEAGEFARDLDRIDADNIIVKINSPGGDVFDGIAIYNMLLQKNARIITQVEGIAASMASIIALAAKEGDRQIAKSAYYMIHNPSTFAWGDHRAMEKARDRLKGTIGDSMTGIYSDASGKTPEAIEQIMDDETWYVGQKAIDAGFINGITTGTDSTAQSTGQFNLDVFSHAPATKPEPLTKRQMEQKLTQDAGFSRSDARQLLNGGYQALGMQDAAEEDPETISKLKQLAKQMEVTS